MVQTGEMIMVLISIEHWWNGTDGGNEYRGNEYGGNEY